MKRLEYRDRMTAFIVEDLADGRQMREGPYHPRHQRVVAIRAQMAAEAEISRLHEEFEAERAEAVRQAMPEPSRRHGGVALPGPVNSNAVDLHYVGSTSPEVAQAVRDGWRHPELE